ncbi:deoxyribonuclease-1-like isoform X2 [Pungitius pungitius]|uniref:deoxyribonuclease-1-like isoform X2 n=1 Tax=Pungitius pungitius TaxID=134920 RepID=UPI002E112174
MRWLCALGLLSALLHLSTSLRLGAFNIQTFGKAKIEKVEVMDIITTIVHRYDIILIQEVRDSDLTATEKLMDHVNKRSIDYNYTVSEPLGPNTYKERYLFLYRTSMVSVLDTNQYPEGGAFTRPPYAVKFSSPHTVVKEFVLIPQHTTPTAAVKQIDALRDVVDDVITRMATNNVVLLGDFNAGCTYVKESDWKDIRLFTEDRFHWLITNTQFSSVKKDCPYDRIVVTNEMNIGVKPNSAQVYRFDKASNVSDHYPVEVELN